MNLPNKVTVSRFVLSIIYFILLYLGITENQKSEVVNITYIYAGLAVFLIAAFTDILDGYLARKFNTITKFGRIIDPFVDKVLICGSFIFFLGWDALSPFIPSWIVLAIVVREFAVHGLRTIAESKGVAFGANIWGKQKTLIQCTTVVTCLFYLIYKGYSAETWWIEIILHALVWLTLFATVFSAFTYFYKIRNMLKQVVDE